MNPGNIQGAPHLPHVLGFAGHRSVKNPGHLRKVIVDEIHAHLRIHGDQAICYSSAAAGADLVFLDAAATLGCTSWVILPFPASRFAEDFESPAEWEKARAFMQSADWHGTLTPDPAEPPAENEYQFAARRILRVAGQMLFYWDGQPARGPGGTAETIDDAIRENIPARIINADTLAITTT